MAIQDIGSFTLSPDVIIPAENEKELALPDNAIQFHFNPREGKDEGLIDFIVQQSRKIKPLATSDLESYSILSRQFLNIGKPMIIEGIGVLQKNQEGTYDFEQGNKVNQRVSSAPVTSTRDNSQDEISFTTPPREAGTSKGVVLTALVVVLLCIAGALYYFLLYDKADQPVAAQEETVLVAADTSSNPVSSNPVADTSATTVPAVAVSAPRDSFSFKVVIKEYPTKETADKAFARLSTFGHKLLLSAKDSSTYKISMPFMTPLSDTARARDSLKRFFGGKPYIDL